jgi:cytochrome c oxidase subunit 3
MASGVRYPVPDRHAAGESRQAVRFFLTGTAVATVGAALGLLLKTIFGRPAHIPDVWFPPAFGVSTVLLGGGSFALQRALYFVRMERQGPFRLWLMMALVAGTLFIGVQGYGLWTLLPAERISEEASLGVTPFVLMLAALHGLHLSVALLFLAFVATRAWADRYDHEYHWGVRFCAWFWHALGIAWLLILAIFAIAL